MLVYLVGYMGCGKTTVGKALSKNLQLPFFDTDRIFEEKFHQSISEFFRQSGEEAFRTEEARILRDFDSDSSAVIATGGGVACFHDNMSYMLKSGYVIYIEASPTFLAHRLFHSKKKDHRPSIQGLDEEEILNLVKSQLKERETFYRQATLTVSASQIDIPTLVQRIRSV